VCEKRRAVLVGRASSRSSGSKKSAEGGVVWPGGWSLGGAPTDRPTPHQHNHNPNHHNHKHSPHNIDAQQKDIIEIYFIVASNSATNNPKMISSNLLRNASRRLVSSTSSQSKRSSSSTRQAIKCASDQEARIVLPIMTAATLVCGWGLLTSRENEESKSAHCLVGRTDTKAKEVEAKFAAYWPRNIMILFGPPGKSIVCIYFIVLCCYLSRACS